MDALLKDIRYGLRSFRKHPAFTLVAICSLALGIGANTAIFSLINAVLLRPLQFPEPERLVMVWEDGSAVGSPRNNPAPGTYSDWKVQQSVFEDMAFVAWRSFNLTGEGEPEKISAYGVSPELFPLLGIPQMLGRNFSKDEDKPGANKVAILSYGLWQRRFGGETAIVGRDIQLDGEKYSVIGVMPANFQFLESYVGLWVPAAIGPQELADYDSNYLTVVARLKKGITLPQADAAIKTITQRIVQDHPAELKGIGSAVVSLHAQLTGEVRRPLILLLVAVAFVLLICCANLAGLLMSRAAGRRKEIAMRTALGAGRGRIVRQLLTESVLLAGAGGALGLLFAMWSFRVLGSLVPEEMTKSVKLEIDISVLAYALAVSLLTGIIFGLVPALHASKIDLNEILKQGLARGGLTGGRGRLRGAFIVAQVALALVLLVGTGLMTKTVYLLRSQYSDFDPEQLLTIRTGLPRYKYEEYPKRVAFYDQVLQRVSALPGVTSVGYTTSVPLQWKGGTNDFTVEGRMPEPGVVTNAIHRQVSAGYLQAMGVQLRQGRYFDETDNEQSMPVVIVNETMARQFWPNGDALGKRLKLGTPKKAPWVMIVGVVADVRQMGMDVPVKAEMYFPYRQITTHVWSAPRDLVIRTTGDPLSIVAAVRQEIHAVDPDQPVSNVETMANLLGEETGPRLTGMFLLLGFAGVALLLASMGIYGVLSYFVTQQTSEIGVRMALGAQRGHILGLVFRKGMALALTGVVLGLAGALALTRLMASLLFGVSPNDPLTFATISLLLIAVALLACYIPARRATKVDPLEALRYE